ncbi:hypothetical protein Tco_1199022, partial [Tanacetum coccineum]
IDALHLSSAKTIMTLNEKIANLNNQHSKEKSTVSSLQEEKKKLKSDFKIREEELHDKQIQLENKIKGLDNILVKIGVFVSQKAKSREELYFSNTSKTASVSQSILIPNEEFSDDTPPSVARKFLNESSTTHQELHKIVKDEIFPIVNQVDARVQNFEIQFLKKATKFVRDFRSFANKADESLAKHKALEFEIERLLKVVVSQDIMSIVQNNSVVDTSNLQTELDPTKEKLENCIIKKEKEYVVLWNNWYTKCEECIYGKISYDKAYNDMQQNIERLINPFKTSREEKFVPKKLIKASVRTKPITVSQLHVITKKYFNSDSNGLSSTGVDNTTKTRRPRPRSNTKNDRVPSVSKSSCIKNKEVKVEEHHRNLLLSKIKKHISSKCNNIKLAIRNDSSEVVCAMCKT